MVWLGAPNQGASQGPVRPVGLERERDQPNTDNSRSSVWRLKFWNVTPHPKRHDRSHLFRMIFQFQANAYRSHDLPLQILVDVEGLGGGGYTGSGSGQANGRAASRSSPTRSAVDSEPAAAQVSHPRRRTVLTVVRPPPHSATDSRRACRGRWRRRTSLQPSSR